VLAQVGQADLALDAVNTALRLDPGLETNAEVSALREKLRGLLGK
jgi:hypothetical protein